MEYDLLLNGWLVRWRVEINVKTSVRVELLVIRCVRRSEDVIFCCLTDVGIDAVRAEVERSHHLGRSGNDEL